MAEQGKGLYDYQYARFRDNQGTHQGYEFQHGPAGSGICSTSTRVCSSPIEMTGRKDDGRAELDVGATRSVDNGRSSD